MMTTLTARLEATTLDSQQSALIVVDMQNVYATPEGYSNLVGFDTSTTRPIITSIQATVTTTRVAGILIIWFQGGWGRQYIEASGPDSPSFHKSNVLRTMRKQPQLRGKLLAKGSQDYQLVDGLVPQSSNIVLSKPRYSGFFNTSLDGILRSRGIYRLVFTGTTTNVCVESTLCDDFFLEYFGVVLEDVTHQMGPEFIQKAALFNIETFFDWVSDAETLCDMLSPTSFARIA